MKRQGMVVSPSPRAAEAGARVLREGGNAVDAAVSAASVQFLTEPQMCGAGGMGTIHISMSATGNARLGRPAIATDSVIDFYGRAGEKTTPDMWADQIAQISADTYIIKGNLNYYGYTSITTPGTILGLSEALAKYGSRSWADAIAPGIDRAERGVTIDPTMYSHWSDRPVEKAFPTGREVLSVSPGSKAIYFKEDGELRGVGETLKNKDYAATLKRLAAAGPDDFYHGEIAERVITDLEANGSFVTRKDMQEYRTRPGEPVRGSYRGFTITSSRPPGCGIHLIELLNILEGYDLKSYAHNSAEYVHLWAQALRAIHQDRVKYLGDPDFADIPVDRMLSKQHAVSWRSAIDAGEEIRVQKPLLPPVVSTTHVTAVDGDGSAVTLTHTLGAYSGVVTPGLGFMYNNAMVLFHYVPGQPNSVEPGKARTTGMCPTMLFDESGELVMALGSPGGFAIISAVAQTIVNIVDFGMSPTEAVAAPRFHCEGGLVRLEDRISEEVADGLAARNNPIMRMPAGYASGLGLSLTITRDPKTGQLRGGSDPRSNGGLALVDLP